MKSHGTTGASKATNTLHSHCGSFLNRQFFLSLRIQKPVTVVNSFATPYLNYIIH